MTQTSRRGRLVRPLATLLAAGTLLLAGCSGAGSQASLSEPDAMPADAGGYAEVPAGPAPEAPYPGLTPQDRKIARSASIDLIVTNIEDAAEGLRQVAAAFGGLITSESLSLPRDATRIPDYGSVVTVTVPSARLDDALAAVARLGEVTRRSVDSIDVTSTVVDVDSRVKTLRESIARLQDLMGRAGSVGDIAQVEAELTNRQAELEAMLAQQNSLSAQVETSPITVSLVTRTEVTSPAVSGFLPGLEAGWNSLLTVGQVVLTVLGAVLPYLILVALGVVPWLVWRYRHRAKGAAAPAAASEPVPPEQ